MEQANINNRTLFTSKKTNIYIYKKTHNKHGYTHSRNSLQFVHFTLVNTILKTR